MVHIVILSMGKGCKKAQDGRREGKRYDDGGTGKNRDLENRKERAKGGERKEKEEEERWVKSPQTTKDQSLSQ